MRSNSTLSAEDRAKVAGLLAALEAAGPGFAGATIVGISRPQDPAPPRRSQSAK